MSAIGAKANIARRLARRALARWAFLALVGRRRWPRSGRRVAVLRWLWLRLRWLCPVGTRLWLGERVQLSVLWRLRLLLIANYLTLFEGPPKSGPSCIELQPISEAPLHNTHRRRCFRIFETYLVHSLLSAANSNIISAPSLSFGSSWSSPSTNAAYSGPRVFSIASIFWSNSSTSLRFLFS
jgi:hypothetical protein